MRLRKSGPYVWKNSQTGYYCVCYTDERGKDRRTSLRTKDEKEATRRFNAWHRDWLIKWGTQSDVKAQESTVIVNDFVQEWIAYISTRYASGTAKQYRATATKFAQYAGNILVAKIEKKTIDDFITQLLNDHLTVPTVNKHRRHLRRMMQDAEEWKYIEHVPKFSKSLKEMKRVKYLTEPQLDQIFLAIKDAQFRDLCHLALLSAMRSGELINLTASDINNPPGYIRVSEEQKNRTESRIPITPAMEPILEKYTTLRPVGPLFPYTSQDTIYRKFKRILRALDIKDRTFHGLRHTYGVMMVSKGVDIRTLQGLMRHQALKSTMVYAEVIPAHLIKQSKQMDYTIPSVI